LPSETACPAVLVAVKAADVVAAPPKAVTFASELEKVEVTFAAVLVDATVLGAKLALLVRVLKS
jgi:hypothetical protein